MTQLALAFDTTGTKDSMALLQDGKIISRLFHPDIALSNKTSPKGNSQWQSSMLISELKSFLADQGGFISHSEPIDDSQPQVPLAASLLAFYQHLRDLSPTRFSVLEPFYLRTPEFVKKKSCRNQ